MNIKDIAKLAGVSVSTVSKIVNKKDDSISQETRERVLRIVKEYNYSPYASKVTSQKRSWTIGILLNSTVALDSTLDGILSEAQKNGYSALVLNNYGEIEQELKNITSMCTANIDGIIWEPVSRESLSHRYLLEELNIPIQTIGVNGGDDSLLLPYKKASQGMTKTLIDKGHKNIACLSSSGRRTKAFISGYKKSLFENQLKLNEEFIFPEINDELLYLIRNHELSGIVISHYSQAVTLYALINNSAIRVPENFSIISIQNDNDFSISLESHIKISSVIIKNADFGKYICKKIIQSIDGSDFESNILVDDLSISNFSTISKPYDFHSQKVIVVGSINIDTYLNTPEIPKEGKTIILSNVSSLPGGKGLNQAVGIAKLGHQVKLIGRIGTDLDSDRIYKELERQGINTSGLIRSSSNYTGKAFIFVQSNGESMISILPGANNDLSPEDLENQKEHFQDSAFCLLQTEIPMNTIEKACDLAHTYGVKTILKPAINKKIPDHILNKVDILIPNEDSLSMTTSKHTSMEERAESLIKKGVETVIVTLGAKGCYLRTAKISKYFEAADFTRVDTTGAGDAFISALASYLMYGHSLEEALKIANYAAGFSISRDFVVPSLVDNQTLDSYISRFGIASKH